MSKQSISAQFWTEMDCLTFEKTWNSIEMMDVSSWSVTHLYSYIQDQVMSTLECPTRALKT
jgi:hypothetical protein